MDTERESVSICGGGGTTNTCSYKFEMQTVCSIPTATAGSHEATWGAVIRNPSREPIAFVQSLQPRIVIRLRGGGVQVPIPVTVKAAAPPINDASRIGAHS